MSSVEMKIVKRKNTTSFYINFFQSCYHVCVTFVYEVWSHLWKCQRRETQWRRRKMCAKNTIVTTVRRNDKLPFWISYLIKLVQVSCHHGNQGWLISLFSEITEYHLLENSYVVFLRYHGHFLDNFDKFKQKWYSY